MDVSAQPSDFERRLPTGVGGLDLILNGGYTRNRLFLVQGAPGAGKTTLAMQFLIDGARRGEAGVYVTLSETEDELRELAASHGWSMDGITVCDLQSTKENFDADSQYTFFHPAEIELSETTRMILSVVDRVRPTRMVFDSLSEMRLLARDSLRYRRQILALKHYFTGRGCTVLLLDTQTDADGGDFQLESVVHGVLRLQQLAPEYGGQRRRLSVCKLRGSPFRDGFHDYLIRRGGVAIFPRLVAAEHQGEPYREQIHTGLAELDRLLGGGIERGTSAMLLGPSGVGKSVLAMTNLVAAAERGERAVLYAFDESPATWVVRAEGLGLKVREHISAGRLLLRQVDPAEVSPGEFAHHMVRRAVHDEAVRVVVIDSLNGYLSAMPHERFLSLHLHELLAYLNQQGVLTLLVMAQHGLMGTELDSPLELSYLADTVILLRYFEAHGRVRRALSVVKKRSGQHESTIHELQISKGTVHLGSALLGFHGILSGNLSYTGDADGLIGGPLGERRG